MLACVAKEVLKAVGMLKQRSLCSRYISSHSVRKLQIGCHHHVLSGWLNTDLHPQAPGAVFLDATKKFPFQDDTFDYIFSEHQLEHITFSEGSLMLEECFRVLKPGGKIRIAVPSLDFLLDLFSENSNVMEQAYIANIIEQNFPGVSKNLPAFALNLAFTNWGHKFMYDMDSLKLILETAGFTNTEFCRANRSCDENLNGIEFRCSPLEQFKTMIAEATKPPRQSAVPAQPISENEESRQWSKELA
jgi:predicted SAM-dependent methyltransferase